MSFFSEFPKHFFDSEQSPKSSRFWGIRGFYFYGKLSIDNVPGLIERTSISMLRHKILKKRRLPFNLGLGPFYWLKWKLSHRAFFKTVLLFQKFKLFQKLSWKFVIMLLLLVVAKINYLLVITCIVNLLLLCDYGC